MVNVKNKRHRGWPRPGDRRRGGRSALIGAESPGFVGGLRTTPTQRTTKEKTYFVFNDIDLKRVQGSSALIGEHTSSTPF